LGFTKSGEDRVVELDGGPLGVLLAHRLNQGRTHRMGCGLPDHACVFAPEEGMPYNPTTVTKTLRKLAIDAGLRPVRLHEPSVLGPSPSKDAPAFRGSASPYVLTSRSSRLAASSTRPNKVPGFLHRHPTGLAEPETPQATRMQQQSSPRRRPTISRWNERSRSDRPAPRPRPDAELPDEPLHPTVTGPRTTS
jgi:hypothetical protein